MEYNGLGDFVKKLQLNGELEVINEPVNPSLEITEITHRISSVGGKALLFTNNGTEFPVLINAFGSEKRLNYALGQSVNDIPKNINDLVVALSKGTLILKKLPMLLHCLPKKKRRKGRCQQVIMKEPNLALLPILKCWPYDGGKFVTLPIVHTVHPVTGSKNIGMYRMQVIDNNTTAMHWQRHKTGANHYEAWKKEGRRMPVSVILGGDPVYTYAATAPLPENIDEYMLAGFLRGKRVKMVRCITNNLMVPDDADIVIEGYVDTSEELFLEGPFGDHTGFYSLADMYPKFHVTCVTHRKNAVYPATIVGVPPMEDAFFAKATETLFLAPIKMVIQPEIVDLHMPDAGVAHNLAVIKINKTYPGQGKKVISSMFGAGQMMFSKILVVVDGDIDIRDYNMLIKKVLMNTSFKRDLVFIQGPLDVLDHSSDLPGFGGKLGIDATVKIDGESSVVTSQLERNSFITFENSVLSQAKLTRLMNLPVIVASIPPFSGEELVANIKETIIDSSIPKEVRLLILVDDFLDTKDISLFVWFVLSCIDPMRDSLLIDELLVVDATIKAFRNDFRRKWPNIVSSSNATIELVDEKWKRLFTEPFVTSPSLKVLPLLQSGKDYIINK